MHRRHLDAASPICHMSKLRETDCSQKKMRMKRMLSTNVNLIANLVTRAEEHLKKNLRKNKLGNFLEATLHSGVLSHANACGHHSNCADQSRFAPQVVTTSSLSNTQDTLNIVTREPSQTFSREGLAW